MTENEKDDKSFKQEVDENNDKNFKQVDDLKSGESIEEEALTDLQIQYSERLGLEGRLEKEKEKSLRLLADYQNLEKQTIDRINARGDKIILDFLTVYEDFIRAKDAYEKEGGNVDSLNGIIKNMKSILGHYQVKPIEVEGEKFDPKFHEVVQEIEDNDHEEGTIVKEIAKGYIIRGEVMKYSKVCVTKKLIKK
jgi:molecular chaperone GrpE